MIEDSNRSNPMKNLSNSSNIREMGSALPTLVNLARNVPFFKKTQKTDGVNCFLEVFQPREFQVDFSGLMVLLDSSYAAQINADRSMVKYISRSMWNYYHVVLLWRKILTV